MNQFQTNVEEPVTGLDIQNIPFGLFLKKLKAQMKNVFHVRADIDQMAIKRGMPPFVMREIMSLNPLAIGIPTEYGGRGCKMDESISLLAAASYESLALSLTFGINSALFLQPVAKYAQEEAKGPVFSRFLNQQNMGGLMITEPGYGSDALNMQTSFSEYNDQYHLEGTKHWAGLTGWAEYWLLTARERSHSGDLKRDIDFFICDVNSPGQQIVVEEFYENLGLFQIPYGRNRLDVQIPKLQRLIPETTGVKMMLDLLHRSRMQFPGMAMGFVHRLLDESISHTNQRLIGGKPLFTYDQVQQRLAKLQASYTICSAMCANSSEKAGIENDLSMIGFEANSVKSVVTDLMQEAAQSATQLVGAQAYKLNHIAGRSITDSRPFQIFEGSNDILYAQISESLVKMMKKTRESNLFQFLKNFDLTSKSASFLKDMLDFDLNTNLPQRKMVELGQVLGRIVSFEMVVNLGEKGFRTDLINNSLTMLYQEITTLMSSFKHQNQTSVIEDYSDNSSWLSYVRV
ncbi:MAG: acyl-CoA dehydrogenase family protein [Bacteroidota bacterium]|nr:acyl-CoA dehydrogenase [Odoribacter sp.]MDP3643302.1 acyl-CoA dehydrogenase family protein [Bacteroidota bacterium]